MTINRPLRVFLCHSSNDKPAVRELYQKLRVEPWVEPWLDEEDIFPGDDWNFEIQKAIRETDAIIVCLSKSSITKEGYIQREIKTALDYSDEKPERTVYIIPIRLEECKPPERLSKWQYADYFEGQRERGLQRLLVSLKRRAESLGLKVESSAPKKEANKPVEKQQNATEKYLEDFHEKHAKPLHELKTDKLTLSNGMEFMRVSAGKFLMGSNNHINNKYPEHTVHIFYDYWIARYPVTNDLYNTFTKAKGIRHPVNGWENKKDHPVTYVKWADAMAYCQWLNNGFKTELPAGLVLRLPTEAEWEKAARWKLPSLEMGKDEGDALEFPWGNTFEQNRCNTRESHKDGTTSVGFYSPQGDSPYGCADMSGNVWEWIHSMFKSYPYKVNDGREDEKLSDTRVLRGGCFNSNENLVRCTYRHISRIDNNGNNLGFRVVCSKPIQSLQIDLAEGLRKRLSTGG